MFNWLKSKKKTPPEPAAPTRDELVAAAMKNAQSAREAIGAENLQKLAALIQQKRAEQAEDVSPAAQAKKIIAQMDPNKISDFLKFMVQDNPTKH